MLRTLYNVNPYNTTIDFNKINSFSFNFSGTKLKKYEFLNYLNNSTEIIAQKTVETPQSGNGVIYNQDLVTIDLSDMLNLKNYNDNKLLWKIILYEDVPDTHYLAGLIREKVESYKEVEKIDEVSGETYTIKEPVFKKNTLNTVYIGELINLPIEEGKNYVIVTNGQSLPVQSYDSETGILTVGENFNNIIEKASFEILSNFLESPYYYYETTSFPSFVLLANGESTDLLEESVELTSKINSFQFLPQQKVNFKIAYWNWKIKTADSENYEYESDKKYNENIQFEYNNFSNEKQYEITVSIMSTSNVELDFISKSINISLNEITTSRTPKTELTSEGGIKIEIPTYYFSAPSTNISNNPEIISPFENEVILINQGEYAIYDNINDNPLLINNNLFSLGCSFSLFNNTEGFIIKIASNDDLNYFGIYKQGNSLFFKTNSNQNLIKSIFLEESAIKTQLISPSEDIYYSISSLDIIENNSYIIENVSDFSNKKFITLINKNSIILEEQGVKNYNTIEINILDTAYSKISFFGNIILDYFFLINKNLTSSEITDFVTNNKRPSWEDYGETGLIIVDISKNGLESSSEINIGSLITSYLIYKEEFYSNNLLNPFNNIFLGQINIDKNNPPTGFIDYSIENNRYFKYRIYPITEENIINFNYITSIIHPNWEDYIFYELGKKDNEDGYYILNTWKFKLNITSPSFAYNNSKTFTNTFGAYPKMSNNQTKYLTFNFSSLLGYFDENWNYVDSVEDIEMFKELLSSTNPIMMKTPKGEKIICSLSEGVYSYDYRISEIYPTTISFNATQIDDAKNYLTIEEYY